MIFCASRVRSGKPCAGTAAGVSTITRPVPSGARNWKLRVRRVSRSNAATARISGSVGGRLRIQRIDDPCGSKSISSCVRPRVAK